MTRVAGATKQSGYPVTLRRDERVGSRSSRWRGAMVQYPSASLLVVPGLGLFDTVGVGITDRISRSSVDDQRMNLLCGRDSLQSMMKQV
jgi:hypothetical protein